MLLDRLQRLGDRAHAWHRQQPWALPLRELTRLALAVGFVAPGLTKLRGDRFATWDTTTPAGAYFDAIYQLGPYYAFVGGVQVIAGLLLLARRTTVLGAVLYAPVIANIAVLTASAGVDAFRGTVLVTALMLLGTLYLLAAYYPAWRGLLGPGDPLWTDVRPAASAGVWALAWWLAATGGIGLTCVMRSIGPRQLLTPLALALLAGAALAALVATLRRVAARQRSVRAAVQ